MKERVIPAERPEKEAFGGSFLWQSNSIYHIDKSYKLQYESFRSETAACGGLLPFFKGW